MRCKACCAVLVALSTCTHGFVAPVTVSSMCSQTSGSSAQGLSRRKLLTDVIPTSAAAVASAAVAWGPSPVSAAEKQDFKKGRQAYASLLQLRAVLNKADSVIKAGDWDALDELLDQPPASTLEQSLLQLVNSNVLEREDKVAVGTIRRYGLAADVIITLGGVRAAEKEDDTKDALRCLTLAKASLDDVLRICKGTDGLE